MIEKRTFTNWAKEIYSSKAGQVMTFVYDGKTSPKRSNATHTFLESIDELYSLVDAEIYNGNHPNITINPPVDSPITIDFRNIHLSEYLGVLTLGGESSVKIIGGSYRNVTINPRASSGYKFDSCNIGYFSYNKCSRLNIEYCSVGVLVNNGTHTESVSISNCNIYGINSDTSGLCLFDLNIGYSNYFPHKTAANCNQSLLNNTQVYSDIRKHEQERGNILVANLFHTLEFKAARQNEQGVTKIFNYLYQWVSDYGASISRPLIVFTLIFIFTTALSYNEDAVVRQQSVESYQGWQKTLLAKDRNLTKSVIFSAQSIINLGGIIGTKNLVVAKEDTITSLWIFFHSLLSLLSLTMFVFALRRRFKVQT